MEARWLLPISLFGLALGLLIFSSPKQTDRFPHLHVWAAYRVDLIAVDNKTWDGEFSLIEGKFPQITTDDLTCVRLNSSKITFGAILTALGTHLINGKNATLWIAWQPDNGLYQQYVKMNSCDFFREMAMYVTLGMYQVELVQDDPRTLIFTCPAEGESVDDILS
jgi:hypothetical protein